MTALTRDGVTAICGRLDDMKMARVLGTGASLEELTEARTWLAADDQLGKATRRLPSGRVAQLIDILRAGEAEWEEAAG